MFSRKLYHYLIVPCMALAAQATFAQGVAINNAGAPPDPSAILDVSSTTQGTLVSRMTLAERDAISNPATGLIIFNTDCNVFNYNAGTPESPIWSVVQSSTSLTASINIAANPSGPICAGTEISFTATPVNGGSSPSYQWRVNGENVGTDSPNFSSSSLDDGDEVVCLLTSNDVCVTGPPVSSEVIYARVNYSPPASPGSISGPSSVPSGASGVAYSIAEYSSATSYTWTVPAGATITSGQGTSSITVNYSTGEVGTITVTANNECGSSNAQTLSISVGTVIFNANGTGRNGSIQTFTVETTGTYIIEAFGAQGDSFQGTTQGGLGARMKGEFFLTSGTLLNILVGQTPGEGYCGGGGGSFVVESNGTPLLIAGGGGGGGSNGDGLPGNITTSGTDGSGGAQGIGGQDGGGGGGGSGYGGGGGGGFCGDGGDVGQGYCAGGAGGVGCADGADGDCGGCTDTGGKSFLNGGIGGTADCYPSQGLGGYGGGGGAVHGNWCAGGGGGYSGGGGGGHSNDHGYGGGGGSYNAGTNQDNSEGVRSGNGQVIITF